VDEVRRFTPSCASLARGYPHSRLTVLFLSVKIPTAAYFFHRNFAA